MALNDDVREVLRGRPGNGLDTELLARLTAKIESLRARGLLTQDSYAMPPLDTVGERSDRAFVRTIDNRRG